MRKAEKKKNERQGKECARVNICHALTGRV